MVNTERDFYGKQEDEKILYVVHPHPLATTVGLLKVYAVALIIAFALILIGSVLPSFSALFMLFGLGVFASIIIFGTRVILDWQSRNIAYITDRRLVRFEPTTLFATNSRAITWDEVVKVKTYPPNFLWKQLAIGNVVVHARTPAHAYDEESKWGITADDIQLTDVYYYRDLGNYIDKILFIYKQKPKDIVDIRPFVPMPRGQRY